MIITVKKTHIRRGLKGLPDSCAIALAIKEETGSKDVSVRSRVVQIGKLALLLPSNARQFIKDFDRNKTLVRPFQFEI